MNNSRFPKRPYRTHGGVHAPHNKNTCNKESIKMPCPDMVSIPVSQHIGAPCTPTVKVNDHVLIGDIIADSDQYVSAPIHSSISGTVKSIEKKLMADGRYCECINIESDGEMKLSENVKPPKIESKEDFLKAVRQCGLVGLGGAGFPTHVKLAVPKDKNVDTLIINAAECEPYITSDHREILENSWEIMSGVYTIRELLNIDRVIIAIENNKKDAIKILTDIAENSVDKDDHVKVLSLKASYPQGAEKILIKACTNREVPMGGLPADAGCIVMNITSLSTLARFIKTGIPLVEKRITIDGSAIKNPCNVIVPLGTPIRDVIEFTGGYKEIPAKILMGGPMMGVSLSDDCFSVLKQNNAILAFSEKEARLKAPSACIHCGRCVNACPMKLMPEEIAKAVERKDYEAMEKYNITNCMECGCCSFSCPAHRQLVQTIRLGKQLLINNKKDQIEKGGASRDK